MTLEQYEKGGELLDDINSVDNLIYLFKSGDQSDRLAVLDENERIAGIIPDSLFTNQELLLRIMDHKLNLESQFAKL